MPDETGAPVIRPLKPYEKGPNPWIIQFESFKLEHLLLKRRLETVNEIS